MIKYNIQDNIDFYGELYKSLDEEETAQKTEEDNNKCLITNQPLTDKFVTLNCNHKFNYIPLYYDIVNHKSKFNTMEGSNSKLKLNQIRCPYCRHKQEGVLPYYEELGLKQINGVNLFDQNKMMNTNSNYIYHCYHKCDYEVPNPAFNESQPISEQNPKFNCCNPEAWNNGSHYTSKLKFGKQALAQFANNNNYYCIYHKKLMKVDYAKKFNEKNALDRKNAREAKKQKAEEEKHDKIVGICEKIFNILSVENEMSVQSFIQQINNNPEETNMDDNIAKAIRICTKNKWIKRTNDVIKKLPKWTVFDKEKCIIAKKTQPTNGDSENVIISDQTPITNATTCVEILKSGANKGNACGAKIFMGVHCKRHLPKNK